MIRGTRDTLALTSTLCLVNCPVMRGSAPATPRWVKVFGIIALVLVLLVGVLLLTGGTSHGPARHAPPTRGHAP
jgi:hypothetical protein